jgi:hypothetical protein
MVKMKKDTRACIDHDLEILGAHGGIISTDKTITKSVLLLALAPTNLTTAAMIVIEVVEVVVTITMSGALDLPTAKAPTIEGPFKEVIKMTIKKITVSLSTFIDTATTEGSTTETKGDQATTVHFRQGRKIQLSITSKSVKSNIKFS